MRLHSLVLHMPLAIGFGVCAPQSRHHDTQTHDESGITFDMTHIITAASVMHINGVNLLTDPFFSPKNTTFPTVLHPITVLGDPAMQPDQVPVIDAVLLSHESHADNLDPIGRQHFIDGRRVITNAVGAVALAPRPGVIGLHNWQTVDVKLDGKKWQIMATPCKHTPETKTIGFVVHGPNFGYTNGLPNAIWYSGDTVYIEELKLLKGLFHLKAAIMNMGDAYGDFRGTPFETLLGPGVQITMNGAEVAQLFKDVGAEILVPIHYSPWSHYREQNIDEIKRDFATAGITERVRWLTPGQQTKII